MLSVVQILNVLTPLQVIAFLRQPNIFEILKERHGQVTLSRSLREKINILRVEGTSALERLGHDLQLTILLRLVAFSTLLASIE